MVAAMATFKGMPTGPAGTARLVGQDLVPWLRECDGFRGVLVLVGEERHGVITLWDTPQDETSTRPARLAMHDSVSAAAGMSLVDYEVFDLPVLDVVGTGPAHVIASPLSPSRGSRARSRSCRLPSARLSADSASPARGAARTRPGSAGSPARR